MTTSIPSLEQTIERMKHELLALAAAGTIPPTCADFGEVDSYIDRNSVGGFCEDEVMDSLIAHFGGRNGEEGWPDGLTHYINEAQDAADAWLRTGGLSKAAGVSLLWAIPPMIEDRTLAEGVAPTTMFIASVESRHFSFTALGASEEGARVAMRTGLAAHTAKLNLETTWWSEDDINVWPCPVGGCLRDGEPLKQQPPQAMRAPPKPAGLSTTADWSAHQHAEFDAWCAESMIHDGKPLVLFRGTADHETPFPQANGWYGSGIYFTDNSSLAEEYALDSQEAYGGSAMILPAVLHMKRPYVFTENNHDAASNVQLMRALNFGESAIAKSIADGSSAGLIREKLEAEGHDGLVVRSLDGNEYMVFDESQILTLPRNHQAVVDALDVEAKTIAQRFGYDMVRAADPQENRTHLGPIVGATGAYYIQSTGRSSAVIHDKQKFMVAPEMGQSAEVRYESGRVTLGRGLDRAKGAEGPGR